MAYMKKLAKSVRRFIPCDLCQVKYAAPGQIECFSCIADLDVLDESVQMVPVKRAKCGHISNNYFQCTPCLVGAPETDLMNLHNFTKQVMDFDLRRLGAQTKNGLYEGSFESPEKFYSLGSEGQVWDDMKIRTANAPRQDLKLERNSGNKVNESTSSLAYEEESGRWASSIKMSHFTKHLGVFDTEEEAREESVNERLLSDNYTFEI